MATMQNWYQSETQGLTRDIATRYTPAAGYTSGQWTARQYHHTMNRLYDRSRVARNLMNWGGRGVGRAAVEGAGFSLGFWPVGESRRLRFLGGKPKGMIAKGALFGLGVGAAAYAATDNPLLGVAAGVGATHFTRMGLGAGAKLLGPTFVGLSMYEGFREGGLGGAIGGGIRTTAEFAAFDVALKGIGVAFPGIGARAATAVSLIKPLALVAALGYGAYKGATYLRGLAIEARRTEFTGDMTAFNTRAAHTMRQRALAEISRSHTNSRTLLSNEAQLMHL